MNIIDLHASAWSTLQSKRQRLPHALLLTGQAGIGKLELATAFAASLLCEAMPAVPQACGQCLACRWWAQGNHPDFRRLQPAAELEAEAGGDDKPRAEGKETRASQEIKVDQVRALDDFLHVGTHRHGLKVVLVEPAEAMNRVAANALLKTLEEPAPGTVFLLVSDFPDQLLPTVRSRCQRVPVAKPGRDAALRWLAARGVGDGSRWLALAGGAPRLAAELAGGVQAALLDTLSAALGTGARLDALATATQIDKLIRADRREAGLPLAVDWIQRWCHDLGLAGYGLDPCYFQAQGGRLRALAAEVEAPRLHAFARKAIEFKRLSGHTLNNRLFLEDILTDYSSMFSGAPR